MKRLLQRKKSERRSRGCLDREGATDSTRETGWGHGDKDSHGQRFLQAQQAGPADGLLHHKPGQGTTKLS